MKAKCGSTVVRPHEMDEILEHIWTLREKGKESKKALLAEMGDGGDIGEWLKKLEQEGLIKVQNEEVHYTKSGEEEAQDIIRRHRLAERLFADVFNTSEETWERQACELEHKSVLTDEATNAVCAFLGHPPTCPHGRAIPRGDCCHEFSHDLKPFVTPLSESKIGENYRIVFITPKHHMRLDRLAVLGVLPGSTIFIHQKRPSYVVKVGETDIALDPEIVNDIYVKRLAS